MTAQGLTAAGSSRGWRRTRAAILDRDRYTCMRPLPDGGVCGELATTAGHIVPRVLGGDDSWANLRAECASCNYGDGGWLAALSHSRGPPRYSRW